MDEELGGTGRSHTHSARNNGLGNIMPSRHNTTWPINKERKKRDGTKNRSKRVYALVREPLPRVRELAELMADHVL
jgi:hypothetical protein